MEDKEERCPCCHNHCRRDNLHCSRGRKYFEKESEKEKKQEESAGSLLYAIMEAGHSLRHMAKHGKCLDEEEILSDLSAEEQEQLLLLVSRLHIRKRKRHHRHR